MDWDKEVYGKRMEQIESNMVRELVSAILENGYVGDADGICEIVQSVRQNIIPFTNYDMVRGINDVLKRTENSIDDMLREVWDNRDAFMSEKNLKDERIKQLNKLADSGRDAMVCKKTNDELASWIRFDEYVGAVKS